MRAVIFDFDGTILDTETPEFVAWERIYQRHGVDLSRELWDSAVGVAVHEAPFNPYDHLEQLLGQPLDRAAVRRARREMFFSGVAQQPLRDGVAAWMTAAEERGMLLAVASSSPRDWIVANLARLGLLDRFVLLSTCDDVRRAKPHPELYLSAAAGMRVLPERCIAIEDSPNGLKAALAAGCFTVAVPNPITAQMDFSGAHLRLGSLAECSLAEVLDAHCR